MKKHPIIALAIALSVLTAGCGKAKKPKAWPAHVEGTVRLGGAPLASGTITFIPETPEKQGGAPGLARLDPDGHYIVGNSNPKEPGGLKPGRYKVTVLQMALDPRAAPIARLASPERYADDRRTPLTAAVVSGENHFDFTLESTAPSP